MGKTSPRERTPILVIDDDDVSLPIPVSFPDGERTSSARRQYQLA
jgi:hypothetical protein